MSSFTERSGWLGIPSPTDTAVWYSVQDRKPHGQPGTRPVAADNKNLPGICTLPSPQSGTLNNMKTLDCQ